MPSFAPSNSQCHITVNLNSVLDVGFLDVASFNIEDKGECKLD